MAGLLTTLLGAAQPTSFGKLLGENYSAEDERAARLSGFLSNAGAALLNPQKHMGDIGQIGTAINKGMAGSKENRTGYLQEAMSRKLAADKLEDRRRDQEERDRDDAAKADFIAAHPEYREFIEMYPEEFGKFWSKHMLGAEGLGSKGGGATHGAGNLVITGTDANGEPIYGYAQPSYQGGAAAINKLPEGVKPAWDPGVKATTKGGETTASEEAKINVSRKAAAPSVQYAATTAKGSIKEILADPNMQYYTDYAGRFGEKVFSTPEYIGFEARIQPLLSAQFKAFMDQSGLHSQISDKDREAMQALIASIKPGMPQAQLKSALKKIDGFFDQVLEQNKKYLIDESGDVGVEEYDAEGNRVN